MIKKAASSNSFMLNAFRGVVDPTQMFPFPVALDEEQRENLEILVPMAERVLEEQNDPLLNDQLETVPENTINALREVGTRISRFSLCSSSRATGKGNIWVGSIMPLKTFCTKELEVTAFFCIAFSLIFCLASAASLGWAAVDCNLTPAVTAVASREYAWPAKRVTIPALNMVARSESIFLL